MSWAAAAARGPENVILSVVVPTYNERDNVRPLLERLRETLRGIDYEVIFVDDSSPDGTADVVRQEMLSDSRVRLIVREGRRGLASAIYEGYLAARGKYVVKMDADLQHPPEVIPGLLEAAQRSSADIVVASRYVSGGGAEGWSFTRKIISVGAGLMIRLLVPPARKVHDPTSGLVLFRRTLKYVPLVPTSFELLIDLLAENPGARVVEVPYTFRERRTGRSKLNARTMLVFLKHVALAAATSLSFSD